MSAASPLCSGSPRLCAVAAVVLIVGFEERRDRAASDSEPQPIAVEA
jgi:hypothetical protein